HHARIVRDGSEEGSIFKLLDGIFREQESVIGLELAKRRAKRRIYSAQYLTLADKYFGLRMNADSRRCYVRAIRSRPMLLARWDVQRHLAATLAGRASYERGKSLLRSVFARG